MFVARRPVLVLVVLLGLVALSLGKTFTRCQLAMELSSQGLPMNQLRDWVCLVEAESSRRTHVVSKPNRNGSKDYGLFQINNNYWCTDSGPAGKDCNIKCQDLLDDDITDDVKCVKKIYRRHGFNAWYGWINKCSKGKSRSIIQSLLNCFDLPPPP